MAAFAKPLQDVMAGRGYTDTKLAILNILNIDPQAYDQEGLPTAGGEQTTQVDPIEQQRQQLREIGLTPDEIQMVLDGVSIERVFQIRDENPK
jgi:hypothetical protein